LNEALDTDAQLPILQVADELPPMLPSHEQYKSLKWDLPTRWNASFSIIQSVLQHKGPLSSVLCKIGKPELVPDDDEVELMTDLCCLLSKICNDNGGHRKRVSFNPKCCTAAPWDTESSPPRGNRRQHLHFDFKRKLTNQINFRFPRDDLMVTAGLLDFEILKIREIDDLILQGKRTKGKF